MGSERKPWEPFSTQLQADAAGQKHRANKTRRLNPGDVIDIDFDIDIDIDMNPR